MALYGVGNIFQVDSGKNKQPTLQPEGGMGGKEQLDLPTWQGTSPLRSY